MSELASPGIVAAIVVGGTVGVILIVVLAVFIPRIQHQKELRRQYKQQEKALRIQRQMKPLRNRGYRYPNLSKLKTTTPTVTPTPTDSPTSLRSTSYDELDCMEKDMDGDESGEVASQVHEAFHAIKQVQDGNDDDSKGTPCTLHLDLYILLDLTN